MDRVRLAVMGVGGMGEHHCKSFAEVEGLELVAVCDIDAERARAISEQFHVPAFTDHRELLAAGLCDAVLIATPHYFHPPMSIDAMRAGKHVLCEKPIGVYTLQAEEANQVHAQHPELVYAVMFQMRMAGINKTVKALIQAGEIGALTRVVWINTDWLRTQTYYDSGGWRATWSGEGGGVLLNQAPHSLDLLQWLVGMPKRVRAHCHLGKGHRIEVEDDVTAYLEWENGATGVFLTSTLEAPGTNRVELIGNSGRIVIESGKVTLHHNSVPADEFIHTSDNRFAAPEVTVTEIAVEAGKGLHQELTQNFVNAIVHNEPLVAPGEEGIRSLALGNAMLLSGLRDKWVELPLDGAEYKALLDELCAKSTYRKTLREAAKEDMTASFH